MVRENGTADNGSSKYGLRLALAAVFMSQIAGCNWEEGSKHEAGSHMFSGSARKYADVSDGADWPGYGRTFGEQHYSPLSAINAKNVGTLGLAWYVNLPQENTVSIPIAVDGVLYYATGYSKIHAVDAVSGRPLWSYDPQAAEAAGVNLRNAWGVRGIAWWNGKIYTGTHDGRLIAIDAATGKLVWSAQTFDPRSAKYISGAPRVFDGKVVIGFGGTSGASRGYVTTYDAETGKRLWRFYTVPGNPAVGFEDDAQQMAAATWAGDYWKFGGGGDVWNAMAYDPASGMLFIGVGSGYPWNRRVRSRDQGDNLFLSSIVAIDGKTGVYKWHYQVNPGDTWDYDAAMDIELADLDIGGKTRKVLMTAPKNGFFYVIDRDSGKLISAEPFARVTWAKHIDLKSGRPVEVPGARYPNGKTFDLWPSSQGAHSWPPMAFSPRTRLAYIPKIEQGMGLSDAAVDKKNWTPPAGRVVDGAVQGVISGRLNRASVSPGALVAWDPVKQKAAWTQEYPTAGNGGVTATGGNLVFQGTVDGLLRAFSAKDGTLLWRFDAKAPIFGTPITYSANGIQYVSLLTGSGTSLGLLRELKGGDVDPRNQARRLLTFALGKRGKLPERTKVSAFAEDKDFLPDLELATIGELLFTRHCASCHGFGAIGATHAPDLRRSVVPTSKEAFETVVKDGALVVNGMPRFDELTAHQSAAIRQYIRTQRHAPKKQTGESNRSLGRAI